MNIRLAGVAFALLLAGCAQTPPQPTVSAAAQPVPANVPAWQQGRTPDRRRSRLAPMPGRLTAVPASEIPLQRLRVPPGFKVELWAQRHARHPRDVAHRERQDLCRHARHRPRLRDHRQRRPAHQPRAGGQAEPAGGDVPQRRALRGGDRQGAALRRHRPQPERPAGGPDGALRPAAGAAPQLEVHRLRSRWQAVRALRRALQHLPARRKATRRSAATTPTAAAWKWWRTACATRRASPGTR